MSAAAAANGLAEALGIALADAHKLLADADGDPSRAAQLFWDSKQSSSQRKPSTDAAKARSRDAPEVVILSDDDDDEDGGSREPKANAGTRSAGGSSYSVSSSRTTSAATTVSATTTTKNSSSASSSGLMTWLGGGKIGTATDSAAAALALSPRKGATASSTAAPAPAPAAAAPAAAPGKLSWTLSASPSRATASSTSSAPATAPTASVSPVSLDVPIWSFDPMPATAHWGPQPQPPPASSTSSTSTSSSGITNIGGGVAPYLFLANAFAQLEAVTGRIRCTGILINAFRCLLAAAPAEVLPALLLTCNLAGVVVQQQQQPDSNIDSAASASASSSASATGGSSLGVGGGTIAAAMSEALSIKRDTIRGAYQRLGDLGDVAAEHAGSQRLLLQPAPLTITGVLKAIQSLATETGAGSAGRKQKTMVRLLRAARGEETRYLVRTFCLHLRVRVNLVTALTSLARAVALNAAIPGARNTSPAAAYQAANGIIRTSASTSASAGADAGYVKDVPPSIAAVMDGAAAAARAAFSECPDVVRLVTALLTGGVEHMRAVCTAAAGTPVQPMLGAITEGPGDALSRLCQAPAPGAASIGRPFTAEYKYDGQRAQIHYWTTPTAATATETQQLQQHVRIFSRHLEDTTARWPDVVATVKRLAAAAAAAAEAKGDSRPTSFILDTELVAVEVAAQGTAQTSGASSSSSSSATENSAAEVRILPFQVLSTRERTDVSEHAITVRVCIFCFDILLLNGAPLLRLPLAQRRALARQHFAPIRGAFAFATAIDVYPPPLPPDSSDDGGVGGSGSGGAGAADAEADAGAADAADAADAEAAVAAELDRLEAACAAGTSTPPPQNTGSHGSPKSCPPVFPPPAAATAPCASSSAPAPYLCGSYRHVCDLLLAYLRRAVSRSCEGLMVKLLYHDDGTGTHGADAAGSEAAEEAADSGGEDDEGNDDDGGVVTLDLDDDDNDGGGKSSKASNGVTKRAGQKRKANEAANSTSKAAVASKPSAAKRARTGTGSSGGAAAAAPAASATGTTTTAARYRLVASYQPSVRANTWLKIKKDYVSELSDSLDLVPVAGWWGNGRKAGWFSPILVAAYNRDSEQFESVARVMSGFTDARYKALTERYSDPEAQLPESAARRIISTRESPPVWFKPSEVWEIRGADLTLSPVHMAGCGLLHPDRGISLRFPRYMRDRAREDKGPEDATSSEELAVLYKQQSRKV